DVRAGHVVVGRDEVLHVGQRRAGIAGQTHGRRRGADAEDDVCEVAGIAGAEIVAGDVCADSDGIRGRRRAGGDGQPGEGAAVRLGGCVAGDVEVHRVVAAGVVVVDAAIGIVTNSVVGDGQSDGAAA